MITVKTDDRTVKTALRLISKQALPDAVAESLNDTVEAVEKAAIKNVKREFTVRSNFTLKSIKADRKAKGDNIDKMYARVRTNSPYLWMQDEGGTFDRESVPMAFARNDNYSNVVEARYRHKRVWPKLSTRHNKKESFFVGFPKGGGRPYGLYMRHNRNFRLSILRVPTRNNTMRIKKTLWFTKAVRRFGTIEFTRDRFIKIANREIKKFTGR